MITELALQGLSSPPWPLPQQPALAGQLQPAGGGLRGKLSQELLIGGRQLSRDYSLTGCRFCH